MRLAPITSLALFCLAALPGTASAASSYDNCTGFINSLPAVISTQGVWCMNKDLATASASGTAITINGSNITLDCNNFKLGGLSAGLSTLAVGISASDKNNVTVRNCHVRGFLAGVSINGQATGGHVIEDNRFDANTFAGAYLQGEGSIMRRNLILNTGGSTSVPENFALAIYADGNLDIVDNHITDVDAPPNESTGTAIGIGVVGASSPTIKRNTIRGLTGSADSVGVGIAVDFASGAVIEDNTLYVNGNMFDTGIRCDESNPSFIKDNTIVTGGVLWTPGCLDLGGNGPSF